MRPYYADDLVTLYHDDCLHCTEWLTADTLISDPPYGISWAKSENKAAGSRAHAGIIGDVDTRSRDSVLRMWGDRPAVMFGSFYAPFPANVKQILVWQKPNDAGVVGSTMGWRRDVEPVFLLGTWPKRSPRWSSVIRSAATNAGNPSSVAGRTGHPHAKPLDLMSDLIERAPAGLICDPFAGTGSTLIAAKALGRQAIGVEVSEEYCEIAAERLRQEVLDLGGAA